MHLHHKYYHQNLSFNSDNQNAVHLTKHKKYHERTKHINGRYYFIQEIKVIKLKKLVLQIILHIWWQSPYLRASSNTVSNYLVLKMAKAEPVGAKEGSEDPKNAWYNSS